MRNQSRLLGFFLAFFCATSAYALEANLVTDLLGYGDYRALNGNNVSSYSNVGDGYFNFAPQLRVFQDQFSFEVRPETRFLAGQGTQVPTTDPAFVTVRSPRRFVNLDTVLVNRNKVQLVQDFERLALSFSNSTTEIYLGRKPVSIGVLKILPVWNKFTKPLPIVSGPTLIFSSDGAGFRTQYDNILVRTLYLPGANTSDTVTLGEATLQFPGLEIHALLSEWWQQTTAGLAFAKDISGVSVRDEALFVGLSQSDSDRQIQNGFGAEYAFTDKLSALGELWYLGKGATSSAQYNAYPVRQTSSPFRPLPANLYSAFQATYNLTSLWTVSLGDFLNLVDLSQYGLLKLIYSVSDNAVLEVDGMLPFGSDGSEFSQKSLTLPTGAYYGAPAQLAASLKYSF